MREIVGKKPMDFVLYSGRTEVAAEVQKLAQNILDRYQTGIQISTVAIQNVQPPSRCRLRSMMPSRPAKTANV